MMIVHKEYQSLAGAGNTRYGTQKRSIDSLLKKQEPLRLYALDERNDIPPTIEELLLVTDLEHLG